MKHGTKEAFREAVKYTLPIFAGFWFVAFSYGIYMHTLGFAPWYPAFMAAFIFGGSLEFLTVSMLMSPFAPWQTLIVALVVQARHLFYGISMLDLYGHTGWKKPFLLYWMCDETFALNYAVDVSAGADKEWFMFFVSLLNYVYWVLGAAIGGYAGALMRFNTEGLSFVMTALFIVIFLEQFLRERNHLASYIGFASSIGALLLFGAEEFIIPAMGLILLCLTLCRKQIEKGGDAL